MEKFGIECYNENNCFTGKDGYFKFSTQCKFFSLYCREPLNFQMQNYPNWKDLTKMLSLYIKNKNQ